MNSTCGLKVLTSENENLLKKQNFKLVSEFKQNKLEEEAARNWDIFYKRNKTNFYKDRHWTPREFEELENYNVGLTTYEFSTFKIT